MSQKSLVNILFLTTKYWKDVKNIKTFLFIISRLKNDDNQLFSKHKKWFKEICLVVLLKIVEPSSPELLQVQKICIQYLIAVSNP